MFRHTEAAVELVTLFRKNLTSHHDFHLLGYSLGWIGG